MPLNDSILIGKLLLRYQTMQRMNESQQACKVSAKDLEHRAQQIRMMKALENDLALRQQQNSTMNDLKVDMFDKLN